MSCPMVAVTGGGTTFGCVAISLTEAGLAVLDEGGSRLGFVPYDSLSYVVPAADVETGAAMTVNTTDGSAFSCAAISQTSAGVAALDASGGRVGFVPYDTLQYVLPEGKTGDSLPADCSLPTGVAGEEPAGDDEESDENDEGSTDEANNEEESEGVWEDSERADTGQADDEGSADDEESLWEAASKSTEPVDPETPVIEGQENERETETEANADADADAGVERDSNTAADGDAPTDATAADSQQADRAEAGESELQVEWSFGEYDE